MNAGRYEQLPLGASCWSSRCLDAARHIASPALSAPATNCYAPATNCPTPPCSWLFTARRACGAWPPATSSSADWGAWAWKWVSSRHAALAQSYSGSCPCCRAAGVPCCCLLAVPGDAANPLPLDPAQDPPPNASSPIPCHAIPPTPLISFLHPPALPLPAPPCPVPRSQECDPCGRQVHHPARPR